MLNDKEKYLFEERIPDTDEKRKNSLKRQGGMLRYFHRFISMLFPIAFKTQP